MPDLYQGRTEFEPIGLPGHTIQIHKSDAEFGIRITAVGFMPSLRYDYGPLSANADQTEIANLEMRSGELAQWRFVVLDDFEVEMSHPGTQKQWQTRNASTRMRPIPVDSKDWGPLERFMFGASEFFVYENETPRFDLKVLTSSGSAATQGHMEFYGIRYKFTKLREGERGLFDLWVNDWP